MDDGLVLRADVFRPLDDGRYASIIAYGPYAKGLSFQEYFPKQWNQMVQQFPEVAEGSTNKYQNWEMVDPEKWVPDGYVCIRVDSRGAGRSPGYIDAHCHVGWGFRDPAAFERYPDEPVDPARLGAVFGRFGLPAHLD